MTREEAIAKLDDLRDEVYNEDSDGYTYAQAIDMAIESLSAEPSIVRCKDCKHWHSGDMGTGEVYEPYCEMLDTETEETAFCSDGERREP